MASYYIKEHDYEELKEYIKEAFNLVYDNYDDDLWDYLSEKIIQSVLLKTKVRSFDV